MAFFLAQNFAFCSVDWVFRPSKAGRALHEGGWAVECSLGKISATPEFSFPLQFVYLNTRTEQGLFGSQWWCPQLESSLLPKDQGVFVWRMPSGGVVGFGPDKKHGSDYRSTDGVWRASITGAKQIVFNEATL